MTLSLLCLVTLIMFRYKKMIKIFVIPKVTKQK